MLRCLRPVLLSALLIGLAGGACGDEGAPRKAPPKKRWLGGGPRTKPVQRDAIRVVRLRVRDRTSANDQVVRFNRTALRKLVGETVEAQPGFNLDEGGQAGPARGVAHTLRMDVELQALVGSEKGKASVLVTAQMRRKGAPVDEPAYLANTLQEKVYVLAKLQSLRKLYRELLVDAVAEVLRGMGLEGRLRAAPARLVGHAIRTSRLDELDQGWTGQVDVWQPVAVPGQLTLQGDLGLPGVATLLLMGWSAPASTSGDGVDVRELAIKIAAIRRLKGAVPALTTVLLQERRQRIRDLCLGALAEIRDPKSVPALTKYAKGGDEERLRKIIGVLGQIGGEEAKAFLELTADSNQDEEVQKLARETLARLKAGPP